jgi:hypothetical protein
MVDSTIDGCGALWSNVTESPEGRTPNLRHSATRSAVTAVAFIWSYNSIRTGTPTALSLADQAILIKRHHYCEGTVSRCLNSWAFTSRRRIRDGPFTSLVLRLKLAEAPIFYPRRRRNTQAPIERLNSAVTARGHKSNASRSRPTPSKYTRRAISIMYRNGLIRLKS